MPLRVAFLQPAGQGNSKTLGGAALKLFQHTRPPFGTLFCNVEVNNEGMGKRLHLLCFTGLTLHFTLAFKDSTLVDLELGREQGSINLPC